MYPQLLDRFLRYVRIESTANDSSSTAPSSPGQLDMARLLTRELQDMGIAATMSEHGIVVGTIAATQPAAPTIALFAHVDTSPEFTGKDVKPVVHERYDGKDIVLPGAPERVIRGSECPPLAAARGKTVITTDGTTLLGADDKCGIAVIMTLTQHLLAHRDIPVGPIKVCFTCDEEIGRGVDHVDIAALGAAAGYTLDGEGAGQIENETFSANSATVTITGVNIHPAMGKGRMVNAVRIAGAFLEALPQGRLSPETTAGREGFIHPYTIEGGVASTTLRIILRDFETARLDDQQALLEEAARTVQARYPKSRIDVAIKPQYRNMADGMRREPRAVALAVKAHEGLGLPHTLSSIRGGTDGSRLTALGLPTPNLATGMHNFHSPLEWACLEEMEQAVDVLIALARLWGEETC